MFERYLEQPETLTLPHSNGRYSLNSSKLSIFDRGVEIKPYKDDDGEYSLTIDWVQGNTNYKLSELLCHTFKPVSLEPKVFNKLKVLYADGNSNNLKLCNLVWKFPTELGSKEHNGFSFIPMCTRYMVDKEGRLFDMLRKRFIKGRFHAGYFSYIVVPDVGNKTILFRHRAIALAFLDYPHNVDKIHVNHINCIKGDDYPDNLEWSTPTENSRHAVDNNLLTSTKPVIVENIEDGSVKEYPSLRQTCVEYNIRRNTISGFLGKPNGFFIKGSNKFYYKSNSDKFIGIKPTKILVRDVLSSKITEYESVAECSKELKLSRYDVLGRVDNPTSKLYQDGLQMKRASDKTPWYIPDNPEQEILNHRWKVHCSVRICESGLIYDFETQREAAIFLSIAEPTLCVWLCQENHPIFKCGRGRLVQVSKGIKVREWRKPINTKCEYESLSHLKVVLRKDVVTGKITEFPSARACALEMGILETTLNYRLKSKGQKVFKNKYQFKYKSETESFKDFS